MKIFWGGLLFVLLCYFGNLSADSFEETTKSNRDGTEEGEEGGTERSFCTGSQCRKQLNTHSQQMQSFLSMKKPQKLPSDQSIRIQSPSPSSGDENRRHYQEPATSRPSSFLTPDAIDRVGNIDTTKYANPTGNQPKWQKTTSTILTGLVKHPSDKNKLEDIFKIISKNPGAPIQKKNTVDKFLQGSGSSSSLSDIRTSIKNIANKGKNTSVTTRPPFSFQEDHSRTNEFNIESIITGKKPNHQQPLFTFEHPFANQVPLFLTKLY